MYELGNGFRRLGAVHRDNTLREDLGKLAVGPVDLGGEVVALALDAVGLRASAAGGLLHGEEQQKGAIRQEACRREEIDLEDPLNPEAAREALVGE
jgi:hypothetical protein